MFLKIILIILGVMVMAKFFNWIAGVLISHNTLNEGHKEIKNLLSEDGNLRKENKEIKDLLSENGNLAKEHKEIKDLLSENGNLRKENKEIKDLLNENGNLRKNVDEILRITQEEKSIRKEIDKQNIPISDSINNIILLTEKYTKKEIKIAILERDNEELKDKILKLEEEIKELKSESINTKDVYLDLRLEQGDNNKLYEKLLKDSNLIKEEILDMFKNNDIYADENGNAIFPIKNITGQVIGAFELDINCTDKIKKPKFWKQGDLHKAEYLSNKVFKSIEIMKEKYKEIEKDYEQEL